jgi:hypothetical protein
MHSYLRKGVAGPAPSTKADVRPDKVDRSYAETLDVTADVS